MLGKMFFVASVIVLMLTGTISWAADMQPKAEVVNPDVPEYSGPKARIAVVPGRNDHENALRQLLIASLMDTNMYEVFERGEIGSIKREIDLQEQGYTDQTGVKRGNIIAPDLQISAYVISWNPGTEGMRVGGVFGTKTSQVVIQIKANDVATGRTLFAKEARGEAKGYGFSTPGGFTKYKNTPIEQAIRVCVDDALKVMKRYIPKEYYRY